MDELMPDKIVPVVNGEVTLSKEDAEGLVAFLREQGEAWARLADEHERERDART